MRGCDVHASRDKRARDTQRLCFSPIRFDLLSLSAAGIADGSTSATMRSLLLLSSNAPNGCASGRQAREREEGCDEEAHKTPKKEVYLAVMFYSNVSHAILRNGSVSTYNPVQAT